MLSMRKQKEELEMLISIFFSSSVVIWQIMRYNISMLLRIKNIIEMIRTSPHFSMVLNTECYEWIFHLCIRGIINKYSKCQL